MKKKSLMTLPLSLQAEKQAIKAQEDEKKRVDALMRFTKKLCMGLEPTIKNLVAIKDEVIDALYCWMFGGVDDEDSPICGKQRNPYHEDIQWFHPFQRFLDRLSKKRLKSKVIGRIMRKFSATLCTIGQDHKSMWGSVWYHDLSQCCRRKKNPSIDAFIYEFGMAVDDFEDLAERYAPEGSYLSQEWKKLEEELRSVAGLPSQTTTEPPTVDSAKPTAEADTGRARCPQRAAPTTLKAERERLEKCHSDDFDDPQSNKIKAIICALWRYERESLRREGLKRMSPGDKQACFKDVVDLYNENRPPSKQIGDMNVESLERWGRHHKHLVQLYLNDPDRTA